MGAQRGGAGAYGEVRDVARVQPLGLGVPQVGELALGQWPGLAVEQAEEPVGLGARAQVAGVGGGVQVAAVDLGGAQHRPDVGVRVTAEHFFGLRPGQERQGVPVPGHDVREVVGDEEWVVPEPGHVRGVVVGDGVPDDPDRVALLVRDGRGAHLGLLLADEAGTGHEDVDGGVRVLHRQQHGGGHRGLHVVDQPVGQLLVRYSPVAAQHRFGVDDAGVLAVREEVLIVQVGRANRAEQAGQRAEPVEVAGGFGGGGHR